VTTADITSAIRKRDDERRLVYCVVLEPETVDLQDDIVSFDTIEKASHTFLQRFRVVGDQHCVKADADVVESYLAPVDFEMEGQLVRKGSWVMAIKVHDDELWAAVKSGEYTGFSIGGTAVRVPEDD
jgi:DNA adenine methylase